MGKYVDEELERFEDVKRSTDGMIPQEEYQEHNRRLREAQIKDELMSQFKKDEKKEPPGEQEKAAEDMVNVQLPYFTQYQREAKLLLHSSFLPSWWQPSKNKSEAQALADICIACQKARRFPAFDPLDLLQNMYLVNGVPAWKSSFVYTLILKSGIYTRLAYDDVGDIDNLEKDPKAKIRLVGTRADGEQDEGSWISWSMVTGEGWDKKPGNKWKTMPEQMARYRAACFFARAYCPHVLMGYYDEYEQRDILKE